MLTDKDRARLDEIKGSLNFCFNYVSHENSQGYGAEHHAEMYATDVDWLITKLEEERVCVWTRYPDGSAVDGDWFNGCEGAVCHNDIERKPIPNCCDACGGKIKKVKS